MASSQPPSRDSARALSVLDALLLLTRSLSGAREGGMLADTLDRVLDGTGCRRGAAYAVAGDALEIVGERGLGPMLRGALARLPLGEAPWFVAQQAARSLRLVADRSLGSATGAVPALGPDRATFAAAGWDQAVACPIALGREIFGVLVLAWPDAAEPDAASLAAVEIACSLAALQTASRGDELRRVEARHDDARSSRTALLGVLAAGLVDDLGAELATVARKFGEQRRYVEILRARPHAQEIDALAARAGDSAGAIEHAQATAARVRAAIGPSAPERIDLARIAADALALIAPRLASRRVEVRLAAEGEHPVVGRRSDLLQLLAHILLGMAGALDEVADSGPDRSVLIPRAFSLTVRRMDGHEVILLSDASEEGTGARRSFFDVQPVGDLGVDLALVRQIVVAHEGHVELGPPDRFGATLCIVLPAAAAKGTRPERSRALARPTPAPAGPKPVILWIDGDDLFLEIMIQSLPDHDVRIARNGAEASQILAFGSAPGMVFCNVHLPDGTGSDLHAELAARDRSIGDRFVFVADGVMTPDVASYLIGSGRPTLMRPIDLDRVRALVAGDKTAAHVDGAPTLVDLRAVSAAAGAPAATAISGASAVAHARVAPTMPAPPPRPPTNRPPANGPTAPVVMASARDQELGAITRALASTLRREGPKRAPSILAMLRERGLSGSEALSVITFALSTGALLRDPPSSTVLRAADAPAGRAVLVVDDDFDLRQTLRDVLSDEGYEVDTAANGREALDLLRRRATPPVVVLDLMMPVMNGWQFLDELQHDSALADTPVVVISAGKTAIRANDVHTFLSKPLDYDKLLSMIDRSARRLGA